MNLVKLITDLLSGNIGKLTELLDTDAETARNATGAAVPALLSGLASMVASDDGARKLTTALNGLTSAGLGDAEDVGNMLSSDANGLVRKGGGLLSSLFGDGLIGNVAGAISRFSGLDISSVKKLLASLSPLVLSQVASLWKSRGGTTQALTSLFAEQKQNIAAAVPAGFSLASIPGLSDVEDTVRAAGDKVRAGTDTAAATGRSLWNSLAPVAALLLLAVGLWYLFTRRPDVPRQAQAPVQREGERRTALKPVFPDVPAVPNVAEVTQDLTGVFNSVTKTLSGIRDAASATAALPKLNEVNDKIDGIRALIDKLPAAGQTALGEIVSDQMGPLKEQIAKIMALPNLGAKVTSVLTDITNKLAGLDFAQVKNSATEVFTSLTKTLKGITDADSAIEAVPAIQKVSVQLDELKQVQSQMSHGGQSMLAKIVSVARGPLETLIAKVVEQFGVDAGDMKPALDGILTKISELAPAPEET